MTACIAGSKIAAHKRGKDVAGGGYERAVFLGEPQTVLAEQTAERLPAEGNTLDLAKLLAEMMIVKTDLAGASEMQDRVPHTRRNAAWARPAAASVCQSRLPVSAHSFSAGACSSTGIRRLWHKPPPPPGKQ